MTNLNYKDESNCILLAEVFNSLVRRASAHDFKGRTKDYSERKEERCFLLIRDRYLTVYYTMKNSYFCYL